MNFQLKTNLKIDAFNSALRGWLSGKVTGHLGAYLYTEDNDDHRWQAGHSSNNYYVCSDERDTFDLALKEINVTAGHFFDLGPGGQASVLNKSKRLIQKVSATHYYPVDLSYCIATQAKTAINLPGRIVIKDFYEQLEIAKHGAFISLLGLTSGNFETYVDKKGVQTRLSKIFSNYRKVGLDNSYFLVSIDANTNINEITGCYNNGEFGGLIRSCIDRAIDTSGFDFDVVWTAENYQLATGLRANRDQIIKWCGEEFAIERGEFLSVINSYRFPVSFTIEAAARAGWKHLNTWSKTGRVHYLLFSGEQS